MCPDPDPVPVPSPFPAQVPPLLPIQQNVFVPQQTKGQQAAQQQGQGPEGQGVKAEPGQEVKAEGGEGAQGVKAGDVAMRTEGGQAASEPGERGAELGREHLGVRSCWEWSAVDSGLAALRPYGSFCLLYVRYTHRVNLVRMGRPVDSCCLVHDAVVKEEPKDGAGPNGAGPGPVAAAAPGGPEPMDIGVAGGEGQQGQGQQAAADPCGAVAVRFPGASPEALQLVREHVEWLDGMGRFLRRSSGRDLHAGIRGS